MYRVELKVKNLSKFVACMIRVPNVPCGVESLSILWQFAFPLQFLMYRVELKEVLTSEEILVYTHVPNVPCGVERRLLPHGIDKEPHCS